MEQDQAYRDSLAADKAKVSVSHVIYLLTIHKAK